MIASAVDLKLIAVLLDSSLCKIRRHSWKLEIVSMLQTVVVKAAERSDVRRTVYALHSTET